MKTYETRRRWVPQLLAALLTAGVHTLGAAPNIGSAASPMQASQPPTQAPKPAAPQQVTNGASLPVAPVVNLGSGPKARHQCAVLETGELLCWGSNNVGQLGIGDTTSYSTPITMTGVSDAIDVAQSHAVTCILRTGGMVQCVGTNQHGQLGNATVADSTVPVDVLAPDGSGPLTGVTRIATSGQLQTCAVVSGKVLCWGLLADIINPIDWSRTIITSSLPITMAGITDAESISAGSAHICVRTSGGGVQCWGNNRDGQFGDNTETNSITTPVTMLNSAGTAPLTGVASVNAGDDFTCMVMMDGQHLCTGYNEYNVFGNGTDTSTKLPTISEMWGTNAPMTDVKQSSAGPYHNCLLRSTGMVYCAGYVDGGVGTDLMISDYISRYLTVTVSAGGPPLTGVLEIGAYYDAACARTIQYVYCWGADLDGRIGHGSLTASYYPIAVIEIPPSNPLVSLAVGSMESVDFYPVTPTLTSDIRHYTATVPYTVTQLGVGVVGEFVEGHPFFTATLAAGNGSFQPAWVYTTALQQDGTNYPDGVMAAMQISAGVTGTVMLTTYNPFGTSPLLYTVYISREDPPSNPLVSLAVGSMESVDFYPVTPTLASDVRHYTATVPFTQTMFGVGVVGEQVEGHPFFTATFAAGNGSLLPTMVYTAGLNQDGTNYPDGVMILVQTAAGVTGTVMLTTYNPLGTSPLLYTVYISREIQTSVTTIDRVWPGTGLAAGGMPVQIFGSGFTGALSVTVDGVSVPFTITNDGQINFVMPPGTAGTSVDVTIISTDGSVTAADAFTYVDPQVIEFDGEAGGVFTTTDGVVVTIPPQGVSGSFYLTMTPLPPAPGVPGNVLMYAFRLDAVWNGMGLSTLTNPVTIQLPIDENIFALQDGERPWLYQWIGGEERGKRSEEGGKEGSALTSHSSPLTSLSSGRWVLVRGQSYEPATRIMTVALRPMGEYALSTAVVRDYWFPIIPALQ
jgi:alpha-tubulin suppressor-like RCC1 family protein